MGRFKIHAERQPILADCIGRYRETLPLLALRQHFQCIWTSLIPENHAGPAIVVPDGCVDLLWREDRFVAVGPDVTAAHPVLKPGTTILGLRFQPGAAVHWLGLPMTEIVGRQIDMQDVWGKKARDVAMMMLDVSDTQRQASLLQELLLQRVPSIALPDRDGAMIFSFLRNNIGSENGKISLLRRQLDLSERTLRRRSHHLFGYGPKTLDRILRFQRIRMLARTDANLGLTDLAFAAGYADQAHLNREIRTLCGMTAGDLIRQLTV